MNPSHTLIREMYAAFNRRDIDAALSRMTDDIDWPKASEGGRVIGQPAIREYWTRQWAEFDPRVEPLAIAEPAPGTLQVTVHQLVRALTGEVLFDGQVTHLYTLADGLIQRMEIGGGENAFHSGDPA